MPTLNFIPMNISVPAETDLKVLVAARKHKVAIRFGCASARCGTCAVKVSEPGAFLPMKPDELTLLTRMKLPTNGDIRLACQARIAGTLDSNIDISFQDTYSPDDGDGDGSI